MRVTHAIHKKCHRHPHFQHTHTCTLRLLRDALYLVHPFVVVPEPHIVCHLLFVRPAFPLDDDLPAELHPTPLEELLLHLAVGAFAFATVVRPELSDRAAFAVSVTGQVFDTAVVSAYVIAYSLERGTLTPETLFFPLIALGIIFYVLYQNTLADSLEYPYTVFPLVVAGWLVLGVLIIALVPGLARRIGEGLAREEGMRAAGSRDG